MRKQEEFAGASPSNFLRSYVLLTRVLFILHLYGRMASSFQTEIDML